MPQVNFLLHYNIPKIGFQTLHLCKENYFQEDFIRCVLYARNGLLEYPGL